MLGNVEEYKCFGIKSIFFLTYKIDIYGLRRMILDCGFVPLNAVKQEDLFVVTLTIKGLNQLETFFLVQFY